jgi:hypothetical protein
MVVYGMVVYGMVVQVVKSRKSHLEAPQGILHIRAAGYRVPVGVAGSSILVAPDMH